MMLIDKTPAFVIILIVLSMSILFVGAAFFNPSIGRWQETLRRATVCQDNCLTQEDSHLVMFATCFKSVVFARLTEQYAPSR